MKKFKNLVFMISVILVLGGLTACGSSENNSASDSNEDSVSGPISIDGSSTVFPIMEALTYEYSKKNPDVEATVNSSGTGGGFKKSTKGEIDLSNASREIKPEEKAIAEKNGVNLKQLTLAYDGISIVVSQKNDFLNNLTVEQLKKVFLDSSNVSKWSDINPEWPNEKIKIFSPGHDSGTFDYFNDVILEDNPMREGENTTLSEDDNVLVRGIENDPYAIGFFGFAYYAANKDSLKVLGIATEEGSKAVKPSGETIQDGSYKPLSRSVFTYVNMNSLKNKPQVFDFVQYTLNRAGKAAEQVGYVPLPDEKYQKQLEEVKHEIE